MPQPLARHPWDWYHTAQLDLRIAAPWVRPHSTESSGCSIESLKRLRPNSVAARVLERVAKSLLGHSPLGFGNGPVRPSVVFEDGFDSAGAKSTFQ